MYKNIVGFTLVELIVTLTILVVLATVGFISYESYLVDARDSKRLSQMNNLRDGMRLFTTRGPLPIPDDKIDIQSDGDVFGYQGYAGASALEAISFSLNTFDPLDEEYYSYFLSNDRRTFQLLGYLEESIEGTYYQDLQTSLSPSLYASSYFIRYPKVFGKDIGMYILDTTLEPLHIVDKYKNLGYLDIVTDSGSILRAIVTDDQYLIGDANAMAGLVPNSTCLTLYRDYNYTKNGIYTINPTGDKPLLVYCDMDEDGLGHGGGWTFTTFLSRNGIMRGAWDGTSVREYRPDRNGIGNSYGLDLKTIYHTESYIVINTPDLNQTKLDELEVVNFKYDYKNPILDPAIVFTNKTTSSMRWGFQGEFLPSHANGGGVNYTSDPTNQGSIALYHTIEPRQYQGFRWGDTGVIFSPISDRQDSVFYDFTSSAYYHYTQNSAKGWYYVR